MTNEKKPYKVYLNMILGDFEKPEIVKRSIDSVKHYVDGMYITVTYKKKKPTHKNKLVKLLEKYGANISYYKWTYNFANARQFALDQAPQGGDIFIYWQDADDVLQGGEYFDEIVRDMTIYNHPAVYFTYLYQVILNDDGSIKEVLIEHKRERIIRNDGNWKWVGELHELLISQAKETVSPVVREECRIVHLSHQERQDVNLDRNIEILENSLKDQQGKDPRTKIYLGKAYLDKGKLYAKNPTEKKLWLDQALIMFNEYLNGSGAPGEKGYLVPSGWKEERASAWAHIAEIAIMSKKPEIAISAYYEAIQSAPQFPNYYVDLALAYCSADRYKEARHWLNVSTAVPMPKTTLIIYPRDMKSRALEVAVQVELNDGKLDLASQYNKMLLEVVGNDAHLEERQKMIDDLAIFNKACQSIVYVGKYLEGKKESKKLEHLVKAIPEDMQKEQFANEMRHRFLPPKKWKKNEVAIFCGPGAGIWSPKSIETGLGGSEEAVVHMSKALNKLGWNVTVYANPGVDVGTHDGIEYLPWHEINPKDEFNILISWRNLGFSDFNPKTRFHMVWLHDVPNNPDFTETRVNGIDKIAVLSEFHRSLLKMNKDGVMVDFPKNKIFLTSNGIANITKRDFERNPKRIIYSSSPDRGLIYLLRMWPKIIKEVPDAELHIFYGFDLFDKFYHDNPAMMKWKESVVKLMQQKGIHYHGKVGHKELHDEMSKSGIWAYPTDFEEISCITAMKAQHLGAIPVVTDYAALQETVKNGIKVDVDITMPEGQEEYAEQLIKILKDEKKQEEIRKPMMEWAEHYFDWAAVADLWNDTFKSYIKNPERRFLIE